MVLNKMRKRRWSRKRGMMVSVSAVVISVDTY
jgi:hypothetical protein